ncbi:MAG TPA: hypothetical protein VGB45_15575 [Abditibacterium sp.]|jgi:ribosomal protein S6--L-glutamate ligase
MRSLVVVNGESWWPTYFPGVDVYHRRLQNSQWLFQNNELWVFDAAGGVRVDAVLWRLGAIRPHASHRAVLECIRLSGVPCVNPAATLLRGYDRLSMLCELRECGIPLLDFAVAVGENMLQQVSQALPLVLKIGNLHGGYGKAQATTASQWADLKDVAFAADDYATVEPFVSYKRDIRCLAIGEHLWAMTRRTAEWKVNRGVAEFELIEPPQILADYTRRALEHVGADTIALDFLQTEDDEYFALESNDIPGLSGFPEATRFQLASCLQNRWKA